MQRIMQLGMEVEFDENGSISKVRQLSGAVGEAGSAASKSEKDFARLIDRLEPARAASDKLKREQELLGKALKDGKISAGRYETALEKLNQEFRNSDKPIAQMESGLSRTTKTLIGGLGIGYALAQLTKLGEGLARGGINALRTADSFDLMKSRLTTIRGSAAQADKDFEWISKKAVAWPSTLDEVTAGFIQLTAAGLEPTDGTMQALVDTGFAVTGSMEGVRGISEAVGKAWAKQKLQGEQIDQLLMRGVPVWELLSQTMGKSTAELQKLSEQGRIGRDEMRALFEAMGQKYAGAAVLQMETLTGKMSNLEDGATRALGIIGGQASDAAKEGLDKIGDTLNKMIDDGLFDTIGEEFKAAMETIVDSIDPVVRNVAQFAAGVSRLRMNIEDDLDELNTQAKYYAANLKAALESGNERAWDRAAAGLEEVTKRIKDTNAELKRHEDAARRAAQGLDALDKIVVGGVQAQQANAKATNEGAEATNKAGAAATARAKTEKELAKELKERAKAEKGLLDLEEKLHRALADAQNLQMEGVWAWDEYNRMLAESEKAMTTVAVKAADLNDAIMDLSIAWARGQSGPGKALAGFEKDYNDMLDRMKSDMVGGLGDAISLAVLGDTEGIADLGKQWSDYFAQSAGQNLSTALANAFEAATVGTLVQNEDGTWSRQQSGFGEAFGASGGWDAALGLGGAALSSWGQQQGGASGRFASALGGAISGFASGGWAGAIIGAVGGYFSASSPETPTTSIDLQWYSDSSRGGGPLGGALPGGGITTAGHQNVGSEERALAVLEVYSLQRSWSLAYRELLQTFQNEDLFGLLGDFVGVDVGGAGSLQTWLRTLGESIIPDQIFNTFEPALRAGFENYGLGEEFFRALESQLSRLPGSDRIEAFQTVVSSIVETARLLDEAEWSDLVTEVGKTPFDTLMESIDDTMSQISLLTAGWENLTLVDRATELEQIDGLFQTTLGNVLSMLASIEQRQNEIRTGWESWSTNLVFRSLETPLQQQDFAYTQLSAAMSGLEGATTPAEIDRWNAEVQRWLDALAGMVDLSGEYGMGGMTNLEWLLEQAQRASDLATGGYQSIEDELQARYQDLYDVLGDVNERFRELNDTMLGGPGTDTGAGGTGNSTWEDEYGTHLGNKSLMPPDYWNITVSAAPVYVQVVNESGFPIKSYIQQEIARAMPRGGGATATR
jgi:tape measure domain-containing protein